MNCSSEYHHPVKKCFYILETSLPNLFCLAVELMVVPVLQLNVPLYCCIDRRNHLTSMNLERDVLIKTND